MSSLVSRHEHNRIYYIFFFCLDVHYFCAEQERHEGYGIADGHGNDAQGRWQRCHHWSENEDATWETQVGQGTL